MNTESFIFSTEEAADHVAEWLRTAVIYDMGIGEAHARMFAQAFKQSLYEALLDAMTYRGKEVKVTLGQVSSDMIREAAEKAEVIISPNRFSAVFLAMYIGNNSWNLGKWVTVFDRSPEDEMKRKRLSLSLSEGKVLVEETEDGNVEASFWPDGRLYEIFKD